MHWFTWHLGHSYCVRGNGRFEAPWEWGPGKGRMKKWDNKNKFFCFCFSYTVKYSKSPCPICSVQRPTWWLPGHTEHPFHPPEDKFSTHSFTKMSQRSSSSRSSKNVLNRLLTCGETLGIMILQVDMLPAGLEWSLLSCSSLCWLPLAPRMCPYHIGCSHRWRWRGASRVQPCCRFQKSDPKKHKEILFTIGLILSSPVLAAPRTHLPQINWIYSF